MRFSGQVTFRRAPSVVKDSLMQCSACFEKPVGEPQKRGCDCGAAAARLGSKASLIVVARRDRNLRARKQRQRLLSGAEHELSAGV
jgi:hypothetical protein